MIDLFLYEAHLAWHFGANTCTLLWRCYTTNLIVVIAIDKVWVRTYCRSRLSRREMILSSVNPRLQCSV